MSKILIIVIVVLAVFGGLWFVFSGPGRTTSYKTGTPPPVGQPTPTISATAHGTYTPSVKGQGRVVFVVKDAAIASMQGATSVNITVDKVEVYSASKGWISVSTEQKHYNLLQLKQSGSAALLADVRLPTDTYDQIRLNIRTVEVMTTTGIAWEAKLPSHVLKIVGRFSVAEGKTSTVSIDFLADKSLHLTGAGTYILAPVVKLETRNHADVEIKFDESVDIKGGNIEEEKSEGMNEKGEMKVDFELKGNLDIDTHNMIHLKIK